jgi:hypothetical protein
MILAWWLLGCARYDCAETEVLGYPLREECGLFGSFGTHWYEDGMVQVYFDSAIEDFLTEESAFVLDYLPIFTVVFRDTHLTSGEPVRYPDALALCSRTEEPGSGIFFWAASEVEIEVLAPHDKALTGGRSWRMRWRVDCPDAQMFTEGEDVIELSMEGLGYRYDLWGTPADFEEGL